MNHKVYKKSGTGSQTLEILDNAYKYNYWIYEKIRPYLGAKNAEVGAGQGTISELVLEDHKVLLSDIAKYNVAVMRKRFRKNKNLLGVEKELNKKKISDLNCIYSSNVLEHIEDDELFIKNAVSLLKKGGFFVAVVPAMQVLYSNFDKSIGHFRRYSEKDRMRLTNFLEENFPRSELVQFRYFNQIGVFGWFLKMKLLNQKQVYDKDVKIFESLLPLNKFLDRLNLPFGQSVLLVIRK